MEKVISHRVLLKLLNRKYVNLQTALVGCLSKDSEGQYITDSDHNIRHNYHYVFYTDDTLKTKIGESRYLTEYELNDKINDFAFQQKARHLQKSRAKWNKKGYLQYSTDTLVIFKTTDHELYCY